jgi:hypothetical protein
VWALIVSGFGNQEALPLRSMTVMSSDRNLPPCSRSRRKTVPVFPVSVNAESITPVPANSTHAEWSSIRPRETRTNRSKGSRMLVYTTWLERASSGPTSTVTRSSMRARKLAPSRPRCSS